MEKKQFWKSIEKVLIIAALLVGLTSLSLNLISMFLERKNPLMPQGQNEWIADESSVIQVLSMGVVDYGLHVPGVTDYSSHLSSLEPLVSNYNVTSYSQRTLIGTQIPAAFSDSVKSLGVTSVALANDNSMANGKAGVDTSLTFWDGQDIHYSGMNWGTDHQNLIRPFMVNGISCAFLSYTDLLNDELPSHERYLVNVYDDERTPAMVAQAAEHAEVVIVAMYWNGEDCKAPNERQKEIAKKLADAGASVIIGNAPNAIQPVEWIDDTLVFYSMGNILSDQLISQARFGVVGSITITKTTYFDKKKIELTNPKVDLIYNSLQPDGQYKAVPFETVTEEELSIKEGIYQQYQAILQMLDDSIRMGGLY